VATSECKLVELEQVGADTVLAYAVQFVYDSEVLYARAWIRAGTFRERMLYGFADWVRHQPDIYEDIPGMPARGDLAWGALAHANVLSGRLPSK
jgi:hypothetical protein